MHNLFPSAFFNFEALRIISTAPTSGADIGESLHAISKIKDKDPGSWNQAWSDAAEMALCIATEAQAAGNRPAAASAMLRAANYLRAADYMVQSPQTLSNLHHARDVFDQGTQFLDNPVITLDIPYTDTDGCSHLLPGRLFLPCDYQRTPRRKSPILLATNGADSVQEELYHLYGAYGPKQGYAVLTYDGPGQGLALRKDGLRMRPDWEAVVAAVVDSLEDLSKERPDLNLDLECIAIAGASLGAYFALRGTLDNRLKACVAIDPPIDLWEFATQHISPVILRAWGSGWITDGGINALFGLLAALVFQVKWEVGLTSWFFGTSSAAATLKEMKKYTLKGGFLATVKVPVLLSGAVSSLYFDPEQHTMPIFKGLTALKPDQKELWLPSNPSDGGLQAKVGAFALSAQKTFAFLDKVFEIHRAG